MLAFKIGQRGTGKKGLKTTHLEVKKGMIRKYMQRIVGLSFQWNRRRLGAMHVRYFYKEDVISSGQYNTAGGLAKMKSKYSLDLAPTGHRTLTIVYSTELWGQGEA